MFTEKCDYLIIGAGIIGLSLAYKLKQRFPSADIVIVERELEVGRHASGRNSGVLHAGFYYTADSLKARFTVAGNAAMQDYCREKGLALNNCGKLVVARDESELERLQELYRRGNTNGSNVELVNEERAREIEPNLRTYKKALYSPSTATVDPEQICFSLKNDLMREGVVILFDCPYLSKNGDIVVTRKHNFVATKVINCAGLYADRVARDFGFGKAYTIIPFKGLYLKYAADRHVVGTNIYPVPDLRNPFLGVHFTKNHDGSVMIGPTAIPAFWRRNYAGLHNFDAAECVNILSYEALLFMTNSFYFRSLAFTEMRKYIRSYFIGLAADMVQELDPQGFGDYSRPGIRAQLLHKRSLKLVQDFVIEGDSSTIHVLNAVSPAFTCSFPFADYIIDSYLK